MRVGSAVYYAMAKMYRDWADMVRTKHTLTATERMRIQKLLEDAGSDYEATGKGMEEC